MRVEQTGAAAFTATFESEEELRNEHRTNLVVGGLRLPTTEKFPPRATIQVLLVGPWEGRALSGPPSSRTSERDRTGV